MISPFHILAFVCSVVGLVFGAAVGHAHFGWWGILLGVPGAYIGLVIGRLPRFIGLMILRRSASADSLRKK
jgi:hypothetical protein